MYTFSDNLTLLVEVQKDVFSEIVIIYISSIALFLLFAIFVLLKQKSENENFHKIDKNNVRKKK